MYLTHMILRKDMPKYVIDVPSNRVIYFTTDENEILTPGREAMVYQDLFETPAGMTIKNCWNYKLVGRSFIKQDTAPRTTKPDALTENKNAVRQVLTHQINAARKKITQDFDFEPEIHLLAVLEASNPASPQPYCEQLAKMKKINVTEARSLIIEEHRRFSRLMLNTNLWKQYYDTKLSECADPEALALLRDEIGARNFEMDVF